MIYRDFINNTLSHKNEIDWNYYGNHMETDNILKDGTSHDFIKEYFENGGKVLPLILNPETADRFITHYFTAARKEFALTYRIDAQYQLPPERAVHTVSGFFLGLLIENCINGPMSLSLQSENHFPFSYLWFLTFLYHDYGYCVTERENCPIEYPQQAPVPRPNGIHDTKIRRDEYRALAKIKRKLGINLSPFSQTVVGHFSRNSERNTESNLEYNLLRELTKRDNTVSGHQLCFSNGSVIRGHQYSSPIIARYLNYCINTRRRVDHGIVGGYLFYDRMIKNYMLAYICSSDETRFTQETQDFSDFYYRDRHFCKEQLTIFSYISDCILSHNIFKQSPRMRAVYEEYLLIDLIEENFRTITFESNPLLYILAVSDTLEPIKIFQQHDTNLSAQVIADAIDIEYIPGTRRLRFSSKSDAVNIEFLYKKAKGLEEWTSARCSNLENGFFTLMI